MGKAEYALRKLGEVVTLEQDREDSRLLGPALNAMCSNLLRLKRFTECRERAQRALEVATRRADVQSAAYARHNLAEALAALGCCTEAVDGYAATLALAKQCGDTLLEATAARRLGELTLTTGRAGEARRHWEHALHLLTALESGEAAAVRAQLDGLAV
jgi:tetratricopeptide (TPR) repeat protein